jgi:hypothetical protein
MKYVAIRSFKRYYTKDKVYDLIENKELGEGHYFINHYDCDSIGFVNTLNDYHSVNFKRLVTIPTQIKLL